jgi:hypothetical protein
MGESGIKRWGFVENDKDSFYESFLVKILV